MTELTHHQLAEELARVKTMAINEVPLGAMYLNNHKTPRADVLEIKPAYEEFIVTIYDVKRTRADLLSDLRSNKWKKYLPHCHRFYFACVKGIYKKEEIPDGVGLTVRGKNGWYTPTASDYRSVDIPLETMKAVMFHRVKQEWNTRRRKQIVQDRRLGRELKNLGKDVNKALKFYDNWHWQVERLKKNGFL